MATKKKATSEVFTRRSDGTLVLKINKLTRIEAERKKTDLATMRVSLVRARQIVNYLKSGMAIPKEAYNFTKIQEDLSKATQLLVGEETRVNQETAGKVSMS